MVQRLAHELAIVVVVDARVAGVRPITVTPGIDQESGDRAVRFFFGRDGGELDHHMGLPRDLHQHRRRVVRLWRITLEQLLRGHDDLVRRLAPAAAPAHAIGQNAEDAAIDAGVIE